MVEQPTSVLFLTMLTASHICPLHVSVCVHVYVPPQTSTVGVSLAVGAERKRGADQQDALQLAAQLGARSQGGGGAGGGASGAGGESATDRDKKLKNLRKVTQY